MTDLSTGPAEDYDPQSDPLLHAILSFLSASSWSSAQGIVEDHPDLLRPKAELMLDSLIKEAKAQGNQQTAFNLILHRNKLREARNAPFDIVFRDTPTDNNNAMDAVRALIDVESLEQARSTINANPILLSLDVEHVFDMLTAMAEVNDDQPAATTLQTYRELLQACRAVGVDVAFDMAGGNLPNEELMNAMLEYVNAPDWPATRQVVEAHPQLVSDEAIRGFDMLIEGARAQGHNTAVMRMTGHKALLESIQEIGIDDAFHRVENPPDLFDVVAERTITSLTTAPDEREAWQDVVHDLYTQASISGDESAAMLLQAVSTLLSGTPVNEIAVDLPEENHRQIWSQIVAALS
ncbi:MAG: hypothetical protein GYB68_08750 [Chloroflexi bacterium]|nr:hypothetical protein [Chloroflexota bacterium]